MIVPYFYCETFLILKTRAIGTLRLLFQRLNRSSLLSYLSSASYVQAQLEDYLCVKIFSLRLRSFNS